MVYSLHISEGEQAMTQVVVPKMKTIGVLGGMGPQATMDFEQRVHKVAQQLIPQDVNRGYPQMVVVYHRDGPMMLRANGETIKPLRVDPELVTLAQSLGPLVDFLVMPCNAAHLFAQEIEDAAGCKVLSIVDATLQEVQKRGCTKVGLLAVKETLENRLYQDRLEELGVEWETIPDELSGKLDDAIYKLMEGGNVQELSVPAQEAGHYLLVERDISQIILACTELPLFLGDAFPMNIINPNQVLAEAAVRYALA